MTINQNSADDFNNDTNNRECRVVCNKHPSSPNNQHDPRIKISNQVNDHISFQNKFSGLTVDDEPDRSEIKKKQPKPILC